MRTALGVVLIVIISCGCARKDEAPVILLEPSVQWSDLTSQPVGEVRDGYRILTPGGTDGLTPTAIAVAKISLIEEMDPEAGGRIRLEMGPTHEYLPWNRLFDNLRYVSEAFPLSEHDLTEEPASAARLVSASSELSAGLCLIYGRGVTSPTEAEVRGVLYNTGNGQPLAVIHAGASVPHAEYVEHPPEHAKGDERSADPRVLATLKFEGFVLECLRELRRNDRAAPSEVPEQWRPDGPVEPRYWPPIPFTNDPYSRYPTRVPGRAP
jgi:hypothetical protein